MTVTPHYLTALTPSVEVNLKARLIARDESALAELIDAAAPWLLGLAQSVLSDQHESEEVVLDAFRIAWEKVGTLDAARDDRLMPWLLRVTRNRAIDRLRSRRRQQVKLEGFRTASPHAQTTSAIEPDESALPGWHVHRSVHLGLSALPDEQRTAVQLAYFHGLTQSEIAEQLGIPLGTVKTRLRLAFDRLRHSLAPLKEWLA